MANTDQGPVGGFKRKIAERDYLGPDGSVVDNEEEAAGVRYTQLATGKSIDLMIPEAVPGKVITMLAAFAAKTWIGNLVSQFKGDLSAVQERVSELADGNWPGRAPGEGVGTKIDLDALAEAMALVAEETGKLKEGDSADEYKARAREKIDADPTLRRKMRAIPEVAARYNELVGKEAGNVNTLADI